MKTRLFITFLPLFVLVACDKSNTSPTHIESVNKTKKIDGPVFERQIFINALADQVWMAIIEPSIVKQYYLVPLSKIDLRKGGDIYYGLEEEPMIKGKILEYIEGKKLVHSFIFSHRPEDPPSRVSYEIKPMGKMTALMLRHDQFPSMNATFNDISSGWNIILNSLKNLLETEKPVP